MALFFSSQLAYSTKALQNMKDLYVHCIKNSAIYIKTALRAENAILFSLYKYTSFVIVTSKQNYIDPLFRKLFTPKTQRCPQTTLLLFFLRARLQCCAKQRNFDVNNVLFLLFARALALKAAFQGKTTIIDKVCGKQVVYKF